MRSPPSLRRAYLSAALPRRVGAVPRRIRGLCVGCAGGLLLCGVSAQVGPPTAPPSRPERPAPSAPALRAQALLADQEVRPPHFLLEPGVRLQGTATTNSGFEDGVTARSDFIVEVTPLLRLRSRGARHLLEGEFELVALEYTRDSQPDRVLPRARADLATELVERWLYFDAALDVDQAAEDPFAAQPAGNSSFNRITTTQVLLSPYLRRQLSPTLTFLAGTDAQWTHRRGEFTADDPRRDAYYRRDRIELVREPIPLGFAAEGSHELTRYEGDTDSVLDIAGLRAVANYRLDEQLTLGAVAGVERSEFSLSESTDSVYGVRARWRPTERTDLRADIEDRFFGVGWNIDFSHRMPWFAVNARLVREPTAQSESLLLGGEGDVTAVLDAALTTRHPNPEARARLVQDLINRLGLPAQLTGPVEVFADYAQLAHTADVTLSYLGRITTVSLTAYHRTFERLARADDPLVLAGADDTQQRGGELNINRRLGPLSTIDLTLGASRVEGLGARAGDYTRDVWARAVYNYQLTPKAWMHGGLRRQLVRSNVAPAAQETGAFAGLRYWF